MRRLLPILTLAVLAPVVAELLAGTVPVWQLGSLVFMLPLYGAGVLLIRDLTRRRHRGWPSILLLGAAYALVEEGLASQALFSPTLYGVATWSPQVFGINADYAEVVIPLHAVWTAAVPILLAELLFRERRHEPWLNRGGLVACGALFLLGGALVTYGVHAQLDAGFSASPELLAATALVVVLVVIVALWLLPRRSSVPTANAPVPAPWFVLFASGLGAVLFLGLLIPLGTAERPAFSSGNGVVIPMLAGLVVAGLAARLLWGWTRQRAWNDRHWLALVSGALVGHTLVFDLTRETSAERMSLLVLGLVMSLLLALLATRMVGARANTTEFAH